MIKKMRIKWKKGRKRRIESVVVEEKCDANEFKSTRGIDTGVFYAGCCIVYRDSFLFFSPPHMHTVANGSP